MVIPYLIQQLLIPYRRMCQYWSNHSVSLMLRYIKYLNKSLFRREYTLIYNVYTDTIGLESRQFGRVTGLEYSLIRRRTFEGSKFEGNTFEGNKFKGNKFKGNKFEGNAIVRLSVV